MKLILLSGDFYKAYQNCKEILKKENRPYVCLTVKIGENTFAIPLRHHISHKYAFITYGDCGLDYSKSVVINDSKYVSSLSPQIDKKEFGIIRKSKKAIEDGFIDYLNLYKRARCHADNPHYKYIVEFSSLQYFDDMI